MFREKTKNQIYIPKNLQKLVSSASLILKRTRGSLIAPKSIAFFSPSYIINNKWFVNELCSFTRIQGPESLDILFPSSGLQRASSPLPGFGAEPHSG
jgi:hypothetical protein